MPDRQKYLFPIPSAGEIAEVAAQTIRAVKADFPDVTNQLLAAMIGAKESGAIERLENKETKKVPASLFSAIAARYGEKYIQNYMQLVGLKAVPSHCDEAVNALPALAALVSKLACAASDGKGINHTALAGMLTELRAADGVISTLRARASDLGMAA